jgi:hypothetical protein
LYQGVFGGHNFNFLTTATRVERLLSLLSLFLFELLLLWLWLLLLLLLLLMMLWLLLLLWRLLSRRKTKVMCCGVHVGAVLKRLIKQYVFVLTLCTH